MASADAIEPEYGPAAPDPMPRLVAVADAGAEPAVPRRERRGLGAALGRCRRAPMAAGRRTLTVARAVYAALADPLTGDEAARERRAARVRQVGRIMVSAVLLVVVVYAMFPVREYLDQRAAIASRQEQLDTLLQDNERQVREVDRLDTPEEVERRARMLGMIFPDEELYGMLPAPEEDED